MKKLNCALRFKHYALSIGGVLYLCMALFFAGCENFLDGAETKQKLDDAIAYANAEPIEIRVECDEGSGSFLTETILSKKVTDEFNIEFKISSGHKFAGWQAYTRSSDGTLKELSSEYIKFLSYNTESTDGIYKVTATFARAAYGIVIKPRCLLVPKILQVSPAENDAVICYKPVVIKFNIPLENDDGTSPVFSLDTVSIKLGDVSFKNYFSSVTLNQEKTELTLTPNYSKLNDYIENTSEFPTITLKISLGDIVLLKNGMELLLKGTDSEIAVQYKAGKDTEPPVIADWFMTRYEITPETALSLDDDKKFIKKTADEEDFMDEALFANLAEECVYLWGKVYDKDTELHKITVRQYRKKYHLNNYGFLNEDTENITEFIIGGNNIQSINDGKGNTFFCIKIDLLVPGRIGGDILFEIMAEDSCGNKQRGDNLKISCVVTSNLYRHGAINYNDNFEVANSMDSLSTIYFSTPVEGSGHSDAVRFALYYNLRDDLVPEGYKGYISGRRLDYECEYLDKSGTKRHEKFVQAEDTNSYSLKLENIDENNLEAQTFTVFVKYGKYTLWTREYNFPQPPYVEKVYEKNGEKYIKFASTGEERIYIRKSTESEFRSYNNDEIPLSNDYEVYAIAAIDESIWNTQRLYGNQTGPFTLASLSEEKLPAPVVKDRTLTPQKSDYMDVLFDVEGPDENGTLKKWDEVYDSIMLEYSSEASSTVKKTISKGGKVSVTIKTSDLYKAEAYKPVIKMTGIRNGKLSEVLEYNIRFKDDEDRIAYDNVSPPNSFIQWTDEDSVTFYFYDEESGPADGTLTSGNYTFEYHPASADIVAPTTEYINGYYAVRISVDLIKPYQRSFTYTVRDKAGNTTTGIKNFDMSPMTILRESPEYIVSEDKWTPNFNYKQEPLLTVNSAFSQWRAVLYYYEFENDSWGTEPSRTFKRTGVELLKPENTDFSVEKNKFVKIRYTYKFSENLYDNYEIYYTGDYSGDSSCNLLFSNASSNTSIAVSSDAPVLVHTLVTTRALSDCKDWSIAQWESFPEEIDIKRMEFPSTGNFKRYDIPLDKINNRDCYVVIAHYADGTAQKSEVMQK